MVIMDKMGMLCRGVVHDERRVFLGKSDAERADNNAQRTISLIVRSIVAKSRLTHGSATLA